MDSTVTYIDILDHCIELVQYFGSLGEFRGYVDTTHIEEWLTLAAGIQSVDYDISIFDTGAGVCGLADRWAEQQAHVQRQLIVLITRFSFCWCALESAVDSFVPQLLPGRGKINNLCEFLRRNYEPRDPILGYSRILTLLDSQVSQSLPSNQLRNPNPLPRYLSNAGIGIYRVYNLRNLLAHGAFEIPVYTEGMDVAETGLVATSTRIVLLTLQMIAIAKYGSELVEVYWKEHDIIGVNTYDFLSCIHVVGASYLSDEEMQQE
jgi:hypothetical protein